MERPKKIYVNENDGKKKKKGVKYVIYVVALYFCIQYFRLAYFPSIEHVYHFVLK